MTGPFDSGPFDGGLRGDDADADIHHDDAAYVLGALSPADRHRYEQHLAGCARCRESVQAFAGLPGLLSRVPVEQVGAEPAAPPPELSGDLFTAARRARWRRRVMVVAGGAVAAAVCLVLALLLAFGPGRGPTGGQAPPARAMTAVAPAPVTATAALATRPWGTDVTVRCRYHGAASYPVGYTLVVVDTGGHSERISSWSAVPDKTMVLTGTTATRPDRIRAIQVRASDGTPVLSLTP
ncbi:anti-sigma factor [Actinocatenispora thailandica]|uniref:Anti-sigma factor n=1 Tax=Actinocatenispora thailandica TaxID=227318 RepID=A0A7R7HXT0_9ACTN|nr:zf-HC2 domain-containing protein [Actinocatenispora thailandica]BCJ35449.1 anti-sigma factor [Actinocatenispora thailandica]